MTDQFTDTWQKQLLQFERASIFALEPLPEEISEESVIEFIARNKNRQRRGSNPLLWLICIWIPILLLTVLCYLLCFTYGRSFLAPTSSFSLMVLFFVPLLTTVCVELVNRLINNIWLRAGGRDWRRNGYTQPQPWHLQLLKAIQYYIQMLGYIFLCPVLLPFFPLLKIRQLQKQYSSEYKASFYCVFWRKGQALSQLVDNPKYPKRKKTFQGLTKLDHHSAVLSCVYGYLSLQGLFHLLSRWKNESAQKLCRVLLIPFYPAIAIIMLTEFISWKWFSLSLYMPTFWNLGNNNKPESPSVTLDFYHSFVGQLWLFRWLWQSFWPLLATILYLYGLTL